MGSMVLGAAEIRVGTAACVLGQYRIVEQGLLMLLFDRESYYVPLPSTYLLFCLQLLA